ncbi:CAF17-like 4Fe-4S cluster assembly/insertion protein YgfZ [Marinobacter sp. SS21]|uniref:CAF17-like 4Fe-4S cluster assembly/insertion protein YgfZ n=1 Tax=Marinobacter sp. SS21 TaxID=2979460 RepID=UPI0023301F49|nr:folate-binding protein [Marinobacter sp. SS21]MDC0662618.1 folate-binding protein [Marinobacter sp. SS21]
MTESNQPVADSPLPASGYAVLADEHIVRVTGPGTRDFLQGQFSQNLDEVSNTRSPRAAACTPKGRAYCLTRLVRQDEDILLCLPSDIADDIQRQLGKYLMLFRGTTMSPIPEARLMGLLGTDIAQRLAPKVTGQLKAAGDTLAIGPHRLIRSQDTAEGLARFEFWQSGPLSEELAAIFAQAPVTSPTNWRASEIAAGVARLTPTSQGAYVPQMLNWQHLDGIHFKKGCYTGQEVVARMHYLGQLKKSLFRFRAETCAAAAGSPVVAGEREVGEVVNACPLADGFTELLAVVRHDAEQAQLCLGQGGPTLTPMPLPYTVSER